MSSCTKLPNVICTVIDQLDVGICVLDRFGNVTMKNAEYERQSKTYGTFNMCRNGKLFVPSGTSREPISFLLHEVYTHEQCRRQPWHETLLIPNKDEPAVLHIEVIPIRGESENGAPACDGAILISRDKTRPKEINLGLVKQVYKDLTVAELQVIALICEGLTNVEIAERRSRSVPTVKAQVKSILEKSGASNRTQLVRLLANFDQPQSVHSACA